MKYAKKLQLVFMLIIFASILSAQVSFIENTIAENFEEPWSVFPVDMDGDNDMDIVSSSRIEGKIAWWENLGQLDFEYHQISNITYNAMGVVAMDIDADLDIDVVCTSQFNGVELWINNGSQDFSRQILGNWNCPTYVDSADVNLDGMPDILVTCCENGSNRMGWIENLGNLNFSHHEVMTNWHQANSIDAGDIDDDGDIDLIGTASGREVGHGEIIIFYNDGNQLFTADTLYATTYRPSFAVIRDLDLDGDKDVIATICILNQIIWFENIDNQFQNPEVIGYGMNRGLTLDVADFDNDNDMDVVSASINNDRIYWFENDEMDFTRNIIISSYDGAADVYPFDMDFDGDIDILSTAQYANKVSLWENQLLTSAHENVIHEGGRSTIQNYPNPFNPNTTISFSLNVENVENTELGIYNLKGQIVKKLSCHPEFIEGWNNIIEDAPRPSTELRMTQAGSKRYFVIWNGTDNSNQSVSSGIYYSVLQQNGKTIASKKMMLMK